jgi:hypothetical protein
MQHILSGARWNKFEALTHGIFAPKVKMYQEKKLICNLFCKKRAKIRDIHYFIRFQIVKRLW